MNTNQPEQYGRHQGFETRRSERYRHPERPTNRFDDYGAAARGGYGNESYSGTWGNQGNEMGGSRNVSGRGHEGSSGSYYHYESGRGAGSVTSSGQRSYGYRSDYDSHGTGYVHDDHPESLYGSDVSRRFQGSGQGRYDFDRDRSREQRGASDSSNYWDRDNFRSEGYRGSEGSYMGSSYNRSTRGSDIGDYGSSGYYDSGSSYRSSYPSQSYGERQRHDPYARDIENARVHHPDSDYDYDPNHAFDTHKKPYFVGSHNRRRTWGRDYDQDRNRDYDRF